MRLLFLDFDGVLNSRAYFASEAYRAATRGLTDAEVMLNHHVLHLDPSRLALLNRLVDESGARVVISSSWRLRYSLDEVNALLAARGATFRACDMTPRVTEHDPARPRRAREILAYLDALPVPPEAAVILDDDDLQGFVAGHIPVASSSGLQEHHVEVCLMLLRARRS